MRYTYGTSETAVRRLKQVAEVFNPQSSGFVSRFVSRSLSVKPDCAVDLGCGPGFSTLMLSGSAGAKRTCGIDNSPDFLRSASARVDFDFLLHDVTETPFPVEADVLYCRFLLSHLSEPESLVGRWLHELASGGILLLEELEAITTGSDVIKRYLDVNRKLVASQGGELFVGRRLAQAIGDLHVIVNETATIKVEPALAAAMFYPNTVSIWEEERLVLDTLSAAERKGIADDLRELMEAGPGSEPVQWTMRQIALVKAC